MCGSRRAELLGATLLSAVACFLAAGPASGSSAATISFSFQAHVNNVRVRPPLVGAFQLGVSNIHGSGVIAGNISGSFSHNDDPLFNRYPQTFLRARFIGYHFFQAAHAAYTKLTLDFEVTAAAPVDKCKVGQRGVLTLYDTSAKLDNGESADYVTMKWHEGTGCGGHTHGWTNQDGGARTQPAAGGPPNGGQWAIVKVS